MKFNLLVACLLTCVISQAQLKIVETGDIEEIGKVSVLGIGYIKLKKINNEAVFSYQSRELVEESFSIVDEANTLDDLFDLIALNLMNEATKEVKLEFLDSYVTLVFEEGSFYFKHVDLNNNHIGVTTSMNLRKAKKLIGKKK